MIQILGTFIELDTIISHLKKNFQLKEVCQKILHRQVIAEAARSRNLAITEQEIQVEAECQRREKSLEKAADTLAWLKDELVTSDDWEAGIRDRLLSQKLSEALFAEQAKKVFSENRLNFEKVSLYKLVVTEPKLAQELLYQIQEQEISFYEAAHLYDLNPQRRHQCGYEGCLCRWQIDPDISVAIFGSPPGEVIGPLSTPEGHTLLMVEALISPEFTPQLQQEIIDELFQEWLSNEVNYVLYSKMP